MKILISNDDGIVALGIRVLANTMAKEGHEVTVVAPDVERSATGHGITMHQPIRAEKMEGIFEPQVKAYACSGTPSDCVKLALDALLEDKPDFVLSGINQGANLATDILYSGTVSAAMEGTIEGITSIALSLNSFINKEFQPSANFAVKLINQLKENPLPKPTLLNVNIPAIPETEITGVKITCQGIRHYMDIFEKRVDPRGKSYYWLSGTVEEDLQQPQLMNLPSDVSTDVFGNQENYITITPLQYNLTDVLTIKHLQKQNLFSS